ncbi:molybdate ABC transporter substrate-binding protein [Paracoccus suum]|uniref:Molybdate ABC transporter substrate-binding protein n=1 Tax=Paracoccus suum TaxID=2259340 RepID=A0A344PN94_9RHOB|nr:molybdate ABC transporter substrate-binding protein [Paracoccus suum]AXC50849.1 molybdate ABC transporter substrate-binding protein [Paracoccus suum]
MRTPHILAAALALGLAATAPAKAADITIFAAASLKTALDKATAAWQAAHDDKIVVSYAGSPQLARQIQQGAPADIFISAAPEWMDTLAGDKLIDPASRRDLLGNTLVLVAPAADGAPVELTSKDALTGRLGADGKLAMALVDSVPAGVYGKEALTHLGLWDGVEARVAQAENVRAALALVAQGEAPLGIVYATDAHAEPKVTTVATFPEDSHAPIIYPAALVTHDGAAAKPEAASFLDQLTTGPARADLGAEGFVVLPSPAPAAKP